MTADTTATTSSRRAVLAGTLGALLALVAQALGRPSLARATNGDPMTAGNIVNASSSTGATTTAGNGLQGTTSAAASGVYGENNTASGYGVAGRSYAGHGVLGITQAGPGYYGVWGKGFEGFALGGTGVWGEGGLQGNGVLGTGRNGVIGHVDEDGTHLGIGVKAEGSTGVAISADNQSTNLPTIRSLANGNSTAVEGYSGAGAAPAAVAKTGVFGYAAQDASAQGVLGKTTAGSGVVGSATTGFGVVGTATSGFGVRGVSSSGPGGYFFSSTGDALVAQGKIRNLGHVYFKFAGLGTIAAGTRSKTITPAGIDITSSSKVFVTLQSYPGGSISVQRVARDGTNNRFTVYLTANAIYATTFAWFVIS